MIKQKTLTELSKEKKIDQFSVLREILQISFLNQLYQQTKSKDIYFKGGTCLKLLYNSNRFSEDLVFSTTLEKKIIDQITTIAISKLKKEYPLISIKDEDSLAGVSKKITIPTEISKQPLTIRLDFSQREKCLYPQSKTISTDMPVLSVSVIRCMGQKEILAEKYRAIMTRTKGRDLYDFWFLLNKKVDFNIQLIQKKLKIYKKTYQLQEFIKRVNNWNEKELDQDVRKFLPLTDRIVLPKLKGLIIEKLSEAQLN